MYGRSGKTREGKDELALKDFNGRVLVKEQDPETSFIDWLYVRAVKNDGTTMLIMPDVPALKELDGNYLIMREGEQIELKFDIPHNSQSFRYFLVTHGYYVPNRDVWGATWPAENQK